MKITLTRSEAYTKELSIRLTNEEYDNVFTTCHNCGELMLVSETAEINGYYYCDRCSFVCPYCDSVHPITDAYYFEDSSEPFCRHCYENEGFNCDDCGSHFRYEDSLRERDDCFYCEECCDRHSSLIDDYHSFKEYGEIVFHGKEDRTEAPYMGFELEVDSGEYVNFETPINWIKDKFPDFFHFEHDGSLNYGWENISQPASLSYHLSQMDGYRGMFAKLTEYGLRSNDINTCGLHVHIDRTYFTGCEDSAIAKLLYIFEKFSDELRTFSRRSSSQINDWARSRKAKNPDAKQWIKKAIKDSKGYCEHSERYYAVNLTNDNTIEIRLWKGTLNAETFEATLKFTARIAEICKNTRAVDIASMSFDDLLGDDAVIRSYWNRISGKGGEQ